MTPFASTYRVQLHADFDFEAAGALVSYWRDLGVGACYSSPVFAARPGSRHGYDVVDPRRIDPQLGGRDGFDRFSGGLQEAGLGLLLDIVPNHQAATTMNETWRTMLAEGPESRAGRVFDIDWSAEEGVDPGRLVWPLLGTPVEEEIASGHLRLQRSPAGEWALHYFDEELPVSGPVASATDIEEVLGRQYYRLAQWRTGAHARNYRRFFDVSDLAGVRVDDEDVFETTHGLVFELLRAGAVSALRIDHIDGLADPRQYLERIAARTGNTYTVVEKILAADETLPDGWAVAGTTGYEILNEITGLFIDPVGREMLEDALLAENGSVRFPAVERRAKRDVLEELFDPEWAHVRRALAEAAKAIGSDFGEDAMADALAATTIAMRVYRTYVVDGRARGEDRRRIEEAVAGATTEPGVDPGALGAIAQLLLGDEIPDEALDPRARLLRSWQQLSGPVMAKGHEDTACYRYPVLLAQAEVGGDPGDSAIDALDRFHRGVIGRFTRGERGLTATSTHDTKRSEDVRARLSVLSERAEEFEAALANWRAAVGVGTDRDIDDVSLVEQRFVAQTLLGAWPLEQHELGPFASRVREYLTKALREAKQETSWLDPDVAHEARVIALAERSIADDGRLFLSVFGALLEVLMLHGACNSLAQVVVKIALPGVPDIYQGTELWDFSLVDPDNRRTVDYERRRAMLDGLDRPHEDIDAMCNALRLGWRSGAVKLFVTSRGLRARRDHASLFVGGEYIQLSSTGTHASSVLAFARRLEDQWALAVVPRLTTRMTGPARPPRPPIGSDVWRDTAIVLPEAAPSEWHDVLCGVPLATENGHLLVGQALRRLPVALFVSP